ncbi:RNA polymerase sigma factor [Pendulispora rubella]|uniref:RNA polymerase sigma factor n=1 Tax=Pendulispora rubella TaxID=2741070 RepID=A0ABZ2L056_9BACT
MLRRARQLLDEDAARDVVQEIFVSLLADPTQLGGKNSVVAWLYTVTTHKCLNRLRNERTRGRILGLRGRSMPEGHDPRPEQSLAMRDFLAGLPEDLGMAAVHSWLDGMSHEEVALALDCSARRVGYLLEQVRARAAKKGLSW